MAFAHELTDVEFTLAPHGRCARITHMRVVRPHNDLRASALSIQMSNQSLKCLGHMAITQVPGRNAPTEHSAVVLLGILCQPCILLGSENVTLGDLSIAFGLISGM